MKCLYIYNIYIFRLLINLFNDKIFLVKMMIWLFEKMKIMSKENI